MTLYRAIIAARGCSSLQMMRKILNKLIAPRQTTEDLLRQTSECVHQLLYLYQPLYENSESSRREVISRILAAAALLAGDVRLSNEVLVEGRMGRCVVQPPSMATLFGIHCVRVGSIMTASPSKA